MEKEAPGSNRVQAQTQQPSHTLRNREGYTHGRLVVEFKVEVWLFCNWLVLLRAESDALSATTAL